MARQPSPWDLSPSEKLMMQGHLPRLVFSDTIGTSRDWRALEERHPSTPLGSFRGYIYHLFDSSGDPVYFGKTIYPSRRFVSHARKPWWRDVAHLNLYIVSCDGHPHELCRGFGLNPGSAIDRTTVLWETKAINNVRPRYNIAGVPA